MTCFEIQKYNVERTITDVHSERVASLFIANYPSSHSLHDRTEDLQARTPAGISQLNREGRQLYVAYSENLVAGFLESRTIEQSDGVYEQLSWIMTDAEYRGRHIASLLHRSFIIDASLRARHRVPNPTLALLSVNAENPARSIYEKWGYEVKEKTAKNNYLMTKKLPV